MPDADPSRLTINTIRRWAREGRKFAMLTCYDAVTARWLARAGVRALLVGDSAAQMILGHDQTIYAPLDFMLTITAAVRRGAPDCFIMGDMPFMSYQTSDADAIRNAGRFLTEGRADAVKLEVHAAHTDLVRNLDRAGIPVVAHIGWRPARVQQVGVPVVAGRTEQKVQQLLDTALAMQDSGAAMLLIEQSTAEAAHRIVEKLSIPVIGCGAGPDCHGQVVILHDLLGLTDQRPSFVKPLADLGKHITDAAAQWVQLVESGRFLRDDHPYKMER